MKDITIRSNGKQVKKVIDVATELRDSHISTVPLYEAKLPSVEWADLQKRLWDDRELPKFNTAWG